MRACMHENTKFSLSHILDAYFKVGEYIVSIDGKPLHAQAHHVAAGRSRGDHRGVIEDLR